MSALALYVEYRGRTRDGAGVGGRAVTADLVDFVGSRFRSSWRTLRVFDVDRSVEDREVGRIRPHPETDRRTWWAESPRPATEDAARALPQRSATPRPDLDTVLEDVRAAAVRMAQHDPAWAAVLGPAESTARTERRPALRKA